MINTMINMLQLLDRNKKNTLLIISTAFAYVPKNDIVETSKNKKKDKRFHLIIEDIVST